MFYKARETNLIIFFAEKKVNAVVEVQGFFIICLFIAGVYKRNKTHEKVLDCAAVLVQQQLSSSKSQMVQYK